MSLPCQVEFKFNRADKTYRDGDSILGDLILLCNSEMKHDGITVTMEGAVNLQLSAKNFGVLDAINAGNVKPIPIVAATEAVLCPPGRLSSGTTKIAFDFLLKARPNRRLYDTYHGVYVAVQYTVKCCIKRSFPNKDIVKCGEFQVECRDTENKATKTPLAFSMTPEGAKVRNRSLLGALPKFLIRGSIDSVSCVISEPFTGEIVVDHCDRPINSIELQLLRMETVGEEQVSEATEVQNIQIAEGDVFRGLAIPIYMIFPRLFSCASVETPNFKVAFQVNVIVVFENQHMIAESFPITLHRR